jgi:hypothetical protein
LLGLLAGCSGVQTVYRHADLYLDWKANEYFDLDHAQESALKPAIDSVLKWHRQNELPVYVQMLEMVQAKLKGNITLAELREFDAEARARSRVSVIRGALTGAPILATLTPQEIDRLKHQLAKDNADFVDKYARGPMEKQQARRVTRFVDNVEYWVGSLNDAQLLQIKRIIAEAPTRYALQLAERQRIQQEFIALLSAKNNADALKPKLAAWIADWDAGRSPEFVEETRIANDQFVRMCHLVIETMTPAQHEHAQKMLQSYIDAMRALIAESH